MPPSRLLQKRCTCEECIQKHPNGTLIESRLLPFHQKRVRDEFARHDETSCRVDSPLDPFSLDDLAGRLFALTLTDNGTNVEESTNKLWNSRAEFQANGPSRFLISSPPTPVPLTEVVASLSRLRLSHDSRPSHGNSLPDSHRPGVPSSAHPTTVLLDSQLSKRADYRSTKALKLLSNIEVEVQRCSRLLLAATKSSYDTIKNELTFLRCATQGIRRKTDHIMSRKAEVSKALDELECQLMSSQDSTNPGPVEFDSSEWFSDDVDEYR
ncbi:hypothetical protein L210DRAFT_875599 [Boletus edulis BED1]|uniref:Uncharacterized protein n=1 Tax=Boletus edulis BED1 TaxID=1328754 RepID=A0AAD4G9H7_BOLED|nr:hypothetical protein L210DRAFT_875599 [Boletus edulis BED1]